MYRLERIIKTIYLELENLGYKPVIIGTYALIIQGWLPASYIDETNDIYVDEPMVVFDDRIEEKMLALGFSVGRSELGGLYIEAVKPIEIIYSIHDFFIPKNLLRHIVIVRGLRVLEGHATLVAKAFGSPIEHLAYIIKSMNVRIDVEKLRSMLNNIIGEVEPPRYIIIRRRVENFIKNIIQR